MSSYNLFVYGTLMWPEVVQAILGRAVAAEDALLKGFKRCRMKGVLYPGLKRDQASSVKGKLLRGLTDEDFQRLDKFEGDEYERISSKVQTRHGLVEAYVYLTKEEFLDSLEDIPWYEEDITEAEKRLFFRDEDIDLIG